MSKPKTRAEEIAYDVGVKDGQRGRGFRVRSTRLFGFCRYNEAKQP